MTTPPPTPTSSGRLLVVRLTPSLALLCAAMLLFVSLIACNAPLVRVPAPATATRLVATQTGTVLATPLPTPNPSPSRTLPQPTAVVSSSATVQVTHTPTAVAPTAVSITATSLLASPTRPSASPTPRPTPTLAPTSLPAPTPTPAKGCVVTADALNLREGPGAYQRVILRLERNEPITPMARSADAAWIEIVTYDGIQGWVSRMGFVCARGDLDALPIVAVVEVTPTPTPQPSPTLLVITGWRGEYYAGTALSGVPRLVRDDRDVNFDWGQGSPAPDVPADNWSARWTRELDLRAGDYRFRLRADDGVRLWVDDLLVLDEWHVGNTVYERPLNLRAGKHKVRVEYFEQGGDAAIALVWNLVEAYPDWRAEYYANQNLQGLPVVVRNDAQVNFDWGRGSPDPALPADHFSARWTRSLEFSAGTYRLRLRADDGVRLWVDGALVIDEWHLGNTVYEKDVNLTAGAHAFRLEYYEDAGNSIVVLTWVAQEYPDWKGEYYNNEGLQGQPLVVRNDARVDLSWGEGGPVSGVGPEHFSVRWTGRPQMTAGNYRMQVVVEGGARLWVNGVLVIDAWERAGTYNADVNIPRDGRQEVKLEYRKATGWGQVHLTWARR